MPVENLKQLLLHDLGDLLFAEKTILKAQRKMQREASHPEMQQRLEAHLVETEEQVRNLERAFEVLGERVKAQKCTGILGIVQEHDDFKKDEAPSKALLEAFNLGNGLRIEHYEIAGYRGAMALAKQMGQREIVQLLKANLEQELAMAKFLEGAAQATLATAQETIAAEEARTAERAERAGARKGGARKAATGARKGGAAKGGARSEGTTARRTSARKASAGRGGRTRVGAEG